MNKFWFLMNIPVGTNVANVPYYTSLANAQAAAQAEHEATYTSRGYKEIIVVVEAVKVIEPPARPAPVITNPR